MQKVDRKGKASKGKLSNTASAPLENRMNTVLTCNLWCSCNIVPAVHLFGLLNQRNWFEPMFPQLLGLNNKSDFSSDMKLTWEFEVLAEKKRTKKNLFFWLTPKRNTPKELCGGTGSGATLYQHPITESHPLHSCFSLIFPNQTVKGRYWTSHWLRGEVLNLWSKVQAFPIAVSYNFYCHSCLYGFQRIFWYLYFLVDCLSFVIPCFHFDICIGTYFHSVPGVWQLNLCCQSRLCKNMTGL